MDVTRHMIGKTCLFMFFCLILFTIFPLEPILAQEESTDNILVDTRDKSMTLAPGDRINISYVDVGRQGNLVEKSSVVRIREDGTIFHELLGVVSLGGLSISEAEDLLLTEFSRYYTNPKVGVNIVEQTKYKVLLYGEVKRVGVYLVSPSTRVAEFIIENGGTAEGADLKNIRVARNDGNTLIFNMEQYLFTNDPVNNVTLHDNDKVIVPRLTDLEKYSEVSQNYILQYGNVLEITVNEIHQAEFHPTQTEIYVIDKNGGIYHRLFGLVELAGTSLESAQNKLTVLAKNYYRNPFVTIKVQQISSRYVFAFGELMRPGIYPLEGNVRIAEFLAHIGGMTASADYKKIIITREEGETVEFNFDKYLFKRDDRNNIYLENGDRIVVLPKERGLLKNISEALTPLTTIFSILTMAISLYLITSK